jgi:hypothetical protein
MPVRSLLALGLMLAGVPALAAGPPVPKPFWGRWSSTAATCHTGPPLHEVRIDAKGLYYWETSHELVRVVSQSPNRVRMRAAFWNSEADDPNKPEARESLEIRLLAGGLRLVIQVDGQSPVFYVRCKGERRDQNW